MAVFTVEESEWDGRDKPGRPLHRAGSGDHPGCDPRPAVRAGFATAIQGKRASSFLDETSLEADGHAVHPAVNFVIAIHQANRFGFRSAFEHLVPTAQFQILDQDDTIAVGEYIAMGILDDPFRCRGLRLGFPRPLMATSDAFPFLGEFQYFSHFAHWAGWFAHEVKG